MAGTGGNMMAGFLTQGSGQSGFGVELSGFHAPSREFLGRLETVVHDMVRIDKIAQYEDNGYVTFLGVQNTYDPPTTGRRMASFRREPHKFFSELSAFLRSIRAAYVDQLVLTGSLGSLQLSLLYSPATGAEDMNV